MPASMPYKLFKQRHPEYDAEYWARCRALYSGGKRLLSDAKLLQKIFPQHNGEEDHVYSERLRRAFYIPYAGQIIDFIVAALSTDPIQMLVEGELPEGAPGAAEQDQFPKDEFYEDFAEDVTRKGGRKVPFDKYLRELLQEALVVMRAWTLVELPEVPMDIEGEPVKPTTLAEEEIMGLRQVYLVPIAAEDVVDWEHDDDGQFAWALVRRSVCRRAGLDGSRGTMREEYTYYTPINWERFAIEWDTEKFPNGPDDEAAVARVGGGTHSFKQVPLLELELPEGLWAMGKIESIAIEHFNKRCALSWGQYRSLFQFLVAKLAPLDPLNPVTDDANRGVNQRVGHGRMMVLGNNDDVKFVGPDAAPYQAALEDLNNLRDEMHRVLHHMAMSVDNSGAALQRSGKSKQVDQSATTVVLKALGVLAKEHAQEIYRLVAVGRGDDKLADEWCPHGMEEFDQISVDTLVEEASMLETISIPSETFQREYKFKCAKTFIGPNASDEVLEAIREELANNISPESIAAPTVLQEAAANAAQNPPEEKPEPVPEEESGSFLGG